MPRGYLKPQQAPSVLLLLRRRSVAHPVAGGGAVDPPGAGTMAQAWAAAAGRRPPVALAHSRTCDECHGGEHHFESPLARFGCARKDTRAQVFGSGSKGKELKRSTQ
jgi:hypothetical protein